MSQNNPPAFAAVAIAGTEDGTHLQEGMSLLDYFAAAAMPALITATNENSQLSPNEATEFVTRQAYEIASEMLRVRKKYL